MVRGLPLRALLRALAPGWGAIDWGARDRPAQWDAFRNLPLLLPLADDDRRRRDVGAFCIGPRDAALGLEFLFTFWSVVGLGARCEVAAVFFTAVMEWAMFAAPFKKVLYIVWRDPHRCGNQ